MSRNLVDTVYAYLRQNYPDRVLGWVKNAKWKRVGQVPLSKIDMARRPGGRDMKKVRGIAQAIKDGEKMEPIVLVDTGDGKLQVADGYHRTLAHKHAGKQKIPRAYIAKVQTEDGPWKRAMHDAKLNKSLYTADDLRHEGKDALKGKSVLDLFTHEFRDYMNTHALDNSSVINAVADKVHEQWMDFAKKVEEEIDPGHAKAWQEMYVPYDELPDDEQEKDRIYARRILGSILEALNEAPEVSKSIQRASPQVEAWATEMDSPRMMLLNWASDLFGSNFTGEVDIDHIAPMEDGEKVLISDGKTSFTAYLPKNGPPRLLKALATSTPTANSVWSILHDHYNFRVQGHEALINGTKVKVKNNRVSVTGKHAEEIFGVIVDGLADMTPSEDYVPINMKLTDQYFTVKPW